MKCTSQLKIDLSNIPVKGIWNPRERSHLFCFGVFNTGFIEEGIFGEGVEEGIGDCWAEMR